MSKRRSDNSPSGSSRPSSSAAGTVWTTMPASMMLMSLAWSGVNSSAMSSPPQPTRTVGFRDFRIFEPSSRRKPSPGFTCSCSCLAASATILWSGPKTLLSRTQAAPRSRTSSSGRTGLSGGGGGPSGTIVGFGFSSSFACGPSQAIRSFVAAGRFTDIWTCDPSVLAVKFFCRSAEKRSMSALRVRRCAVQQAVSRLVIVLFQLVAERVQERQHVASRLGVFRFHIDRDQWCPS